MKQYLLSKDVSGSLLIEWDVEAGTVEATHNGKTVFSLNTQQIKIGIVGVDEIAWTGQRLLISRHVHLFFEKEYPTTDLKAEYLKADEWAVRKKREIKNYQSFMSNWLKRSKGGNLSRGGVIY